MLIVRSALFNSIGLLWTSACVLSAVPCLPLPGWVTRSIGRQWMVGIHWLLAHVVGLDHEFRGLANIPQGPAIYAFKHQSAWETVTTYLIVPHAAIVLKRELTQVPVFGSALMRAGMIGVDREGGMRALRALIEGARTAVAHGQSVIIFPEGRRVPVGQHTPYHPGVAALYVRLALPVVPVALNSGLFWARRSFIKRPGRVLVELLEPIAPGLDRKAFMATLQQQLDGASDRLVDEAGGL